MNPRASEAAEETAPADWVVLAHLLRPQGRKGELLAELLTDFPESLISRIGLSLRKVDGTTESALVESHFLPVGRNAGRIVLKLAHVNSIEAAERLAGFDLVVPVNLRLELEEDAEYIPDLLGCTLFDGNSSIGIVEDVQFPTSATGTRLPEAAPLLVLRSPSGNELLIPYVKAWTVAIDVPTKRITMFLPEGLLDINAPACDRPAPTS